MPSAESGNPLRSFNVAFALLVVLGLALLVGGTIRCRRPA
jgi:hypothetical protein